jgi:hypothetical protein
MILQICCAFLSSLSCLWLVVSCNLYVDQWLWSVGNFCMLPSFHQLINFALHSMYKILVFIFLYPKLSSAAFTKTSLVLYYLSWVWFFYLVSVQVYNTFCSKMYLETFITCFTLFFFLQLYIIQCKKSNLLSRIIQSLTSSLALKIVPVLMLPFSILLIIM